MNVTAQQMHVKHDNLNPEQLHLPVESEIKNTFGDVALKLCLKGSQTKDTTSVKIFSVEL